MMQAVRFREGSRRCAGIWNTRSGLTMIWEVIACPQLQRRVLVEVLYLAARGVADDAAPLGGGAAVY